jgi:hypothetical protein
MVEPQSIPGERTGYEQAILQILHSLPAERMAQLLDFARFLKMQPTAITPPTSIAEEEIAEERLWGQAAVQSLAKYWDTVEEDAAWEHLQKAM